MTDKVYKGQKQIVEGSAIGDFHVIPKFSYNSLQLIEYIGEAKVGLPDTANAHYIQKFIYDAVGNLKRVMIAVNLATAGCTEVSVIPINSHNVRLIAHNGDFTDAEHPKEGGGKLKADKDLTLIRLNTGTQQIEGRVIEINDEATEVVIRRNVDTPTITTENNTIIEENKLILTLNSTNKPYEKRRWVNRKRYIYKTQEA